MNCTALTKLVLPLFALPISRPLLFFFFVVVVVVFLLLGCTPLSLSLLRLVKLEMTNGFKDFCSLQVCVAGVGRAEDETNLLLLGSVCL